MSDSKISNSPQHFPNSKGFSSKFSKSKVVPNLAAIERKFLKRMTTKSAENEKCWEIKYIFHPESGLRVTWDILILIIIIYQALAIPYYICFNDTPSSISDFLEFLMNICFMVDILAAFNTGFYIKGNLIMNRKEIIKDYLKFWFWLDVIASMPYGWFIGPAIGGDSSANAYKAPKVLRLIRIFRFLKVLRLVRLAKLKRILMKIEDYIASNTLAHFFVFGKLLTLVFFIAHWTACLWFFIGDQGIDSHPVTWITNVNLQNKGFTEKYVTSLYWAFTTMSTVGYGDITPFTVEEKIYAMTTMIMASGVFAFTIGSIGALVSKANAVENTYREQAVAVNRYMKRKALPHNLQFRVRRYLDYVWENKKKNKLEEKQVLILLSEPLRDEIYSHIHGVVIKFCKIFDKYESNFISQLARTLINETFAPGDNIIEEGEMSDKLYFIMNGKIRIFQAVTKTVFQELGEKQHFGEISFFTGNPRCASAQCIDFVDVLSLTRLNFNLLSEKFPEATNISKNIQRKCEKNDFSDLLIECYICQEPGHYSTRCSVFLLNYDQDDTKKMWLNEKKGMKSRLVGRDEYVTANFKRNQKKMKVYQRYGGRNVIGIPRNSIPEFNSEFNPYPQIEDTSGRVLIESSTGDSVEQLPHTRANFSEVYVNSEEYASSNSPRENEENIRKASFRLSLIKKTFIEDPYTELRPSRQPSKTSIVRSESKDSHYS